jgi:hypothetical protein
VATLLENEFGETVKRVHGPYGQFRIDVDGREILDAGLPAVLGIIPSNASILEAVCTGSRKRALTIRREC